MDSCEMWDVRGVFQMDESLLESRELVRVWGNVELEKRVGEFEIRGVRGWCLRRNNLVAGLI